MGYPKLVRSRRAVRVDVRIASADLSEFRTGTRANQFPLTFVWHSCMLSDTQV